jgi:predicted negative regulator of RcsB-dependent stress response
MRAAALVDDPGDAAAAAIRVPSEKLPPDARAEDAFATGLAALHRGDVAGARKALAALEKTAASPGEGEPLVSILRDELHGAILAREGKTDDAVRLLRDAADRESRMPYGFGPPEPAKPARELLGDVLLAAGRTADARAAFQAELERAPKRRLSVEGLKAASE